MAKSAKNAMKRSSAAPVSAALRVLSVLEALSRESSMSLEDLSKKLKLAKPTIYRFLLTLQNSGYARRDENERWAMTLKTFNVGSRALDHLDLYKAARPIAEELASVLGETVHMGVLEGDAAVYVLKIESKYTLRMYSRIGRRIPLYCTAIGKILVAYSDIAERNAALAGVKLVAFTPHTITSRAKFDAELKRITTQGYARDAEEHEEGIACIAAPIFDRDRKIVAAISASWPLFRYDTAGTEQKKASTIMAAAEQISTILGYEAD